MNARNIIIHAKKYTDRTYGNTYFAAVVTVNAGMESEKRIPIPYQYGYGSQYRVESIAELKRLGYGTDREIMEAIIYDVCETGCKKRDLHEFIKCC